MAESNSGNNGLWIALGLLIVVLIAAALFFFGMLGNETAPDANKTTTPGLITPNVSVLKS